MKKQDSFYLTEEQREIIRELAYKRRISKSEVVRQIIDDYIESIKKER